MSILGKFKQYAVLGTTAGGALIIGAQSTFAASLTDIVDNVGSGSINTAVTVASGPVGSIVYTLMGIGLLITVIVMVKQLKK